MWHEASVRVIVPVYRNGVCVALVGRAVFGERPKYLVMGGRADSFFRSPAMPSKCTVVVEDILSAIAVGRTGVNAIAVLGTAITPEHAAAIANDSTSVVGWFDDDPAGDTAWLRLRKRMALWPVELHRISTVKDPKALHRQELVRLLSPFKGA